MSYKKTLFLFSFLYLLTPNCLFIWGWIKPYIAIPIILLLLYCLYSWFRNFDDDKLEYKLDYKKILIIAGILLIWVISSGIGGFAWQNRWDHMFRNAIFQDLISYNWPVINTEGENPIFLCYYIGYWLPSALIAKISSINIGYFCQLLYGYTGVVLAFLLISEWMKKISYKTLLIFIFFCGLDALIFLLKTRDIGLLGTSIWQGHHFGREIIFLESSSNTTLLYWVYNQAIPLWIGFMLILLQKGKKHLLFTSSLLMLFSPFPLLGLIPVIIYLEFKDKIKMTFSSFVKNYIIIENITGFLLLLVIALFYQSNISAGKMSISLFSKKEWVFFILFLIAEYGIFIAFVFNRAKKDYIFYILMITMVLCSFIVMGENNDFQMRTTIPAKFYLMLLVIKEILDANKRNKLKSGLLIAVLAIGSITPVSEMIRTIRHTFGLGEPKESLLSNDLGSVFIDEENRCYGNFIGTDNSLFYKYLMKHPK